MMFADARQLDRETIETFRRDGVVCVRGLIDQAWITLLRNAVEAVLALGDQNLNARNIAAESGKSGRFHNESSLWANHPGFMHFIKHSSLAGIAAQLVGSESVWLYNDHLLVKEPGTDAPTPWHQDGTYFRVKGEQIVSAWVGLDPVRRDSGSVGYVNTSHAEGKMFRPVSFATGSNRQSDAFDGDMPDVDAQPEAFETRFFDLEPGDVTFHHARTIHGSGGNTSSVRRRGYSIRFCGDDVRYADRPWTSYEIGGGLVDGAAIDGHDDFPKLWPNDA